MNKEIRFIEYKQLLQELESTDNKKNLLLGNGFNNNLGVKTDYKSIMQKMKEECSIYHELLDNEYDIEKIIGTLKTKTEDVFLQKFISHKIKLDFMKSANEIVKDNIKNIYQENKKGIYLLLKNFTYYFSLNYDPLLYLLLMKYKKPEQTRDNEQKILLFNNTVKHKVSNLTEKEEEIYKVIERDYEDGRITFQDDIVVEIGLLTKTNFCNAVKIHYKGEITNKQLKKLSDLLWEAKKEKPGNLSIDDGFANDLFETTEEKNIKYIQSKTQNVFFLHGTFYFYQKGKEVFKITSKQNKALYERLEDIISNDNEDIICVFKDEDKLTDIKKNMYLNNAYEKIATLDGSLVIIGCSLSENDKHIFEQINKSNIDTVYISSRAKKEDNLNKQKKIIEKDYEKAKEYFANKDIVLFDAQSISYKDNNA